ncbi:MAG TPA: nickel pincer cofactor biosynthesis protein LarC [Nitrospiraceae bacterium]|nr:nickel pincer cofactor biosynthesis protein LarC [Nitrospiraceae bacterium]
MGIQLHFDCFSGISGDMILGSLVDAGLSIKDLSRSLKAMPVVGYALRSRKVTRGGLHATKVDVVIRNGFRSSLSLGRIQRIIASSRVPTMVKDQSLAVFDRLAQAEGIAHRISPSSVQFHEIGVVDSLVDVMGTVLGCHLLGVNRVTASSVNLGTGVMHSAHGQLPVPGPAVTALARGIPVYSAGPARELTTPTGLALLRTLAQGYGPLPLMRPSAIGYGAGSADTDGWPNVLRVFLGDPLTASFGEAETVVQIETNLDDLNPQAYETVMDRLFAAGALDVTLTPVIMKRGRPGIVLTALVSREKAEAVAGVVLRETTALGVRIQEMSRRVLQRRIQQVHTRHGVVRVKVAETERGQTKATPEYRDCKRIAEQTGRPVREVMEEALQAFRGRVVTKLRKGRA